MPHEAMIKRNPLLSRAVVLLTSAVTFAAWAGCSSRPRDQPPLGRVSGRVTLDGQPLPGVEVNFAPMSGRSSGGITDDQGRYSLVYVGATNGAKVGKHTVFIAWPPDESDGAVNSAQKSRARPRIPARYNQKTTLSADVTAGSNTFDFALESKSN